MGTKVVEGEMRFIKKPIPVEAKQWTGDNFKEIDDFVTARPLIVTMNNELIISTLEGDMRAPVGSWIIRGVHGEYYPCRHEVFEESYEPYYGTIVYNTAGSDL